jgi:cytochrome c oxidase subunit 2
MSGVVRHERRRRQWAAGRQWALAGAATLAAATAIAGCGGNLGLPTSATTQGDEVVSVWRVFLIGAVLIAALIWGLVFYSVLRYRHRGDTTVAPPRQKQYNLPLEVFYTTVPVLIVAGLFAITVRADNTLNAVERNPGDLEVRVIGFQWQWQFDYPQYGFKSQGSAQFGPELVLPVGRSVVFRLEADDVNHSFWVPEFLEKRDLIPGVDNSLEVMVKEPGRWTGRCAEYCGLNHWTMKFCVRAVPPDEFDAWVSRSQATRGPVLSPECTTDGEVVLPSGTTVVPTTASPGTTVGPAPASPGTAAPSGSIPSGATP